MAETVKHIQRPRRLTIYDRRDPTRTTTIRARYAREMRKRFTRLRGLIRDAIIEKDVFGVAGGHEGIQGNIQIYADSGLRPGAFAFPRVQDKTSSFMEWLEERVDAEILDVSNRRRIGDSIDSAWQNVFIEDTYKRGVTRANFELRRAGFPDIQDIESRGGISAIMGQPFHADRLGVLYTRAFNELKGITDGLDHHITTVLTQGLADGDGPRTIARKLNAVVGGPGATAGQLGITDSLGRFIPAQRRAEILARTEVIRAHHSGMMQEYRNWGLEGVTVQAEFRTAGDDRVCLECEGLEGQVYSLDEAQNLIPVHPMCRCIVLPARPGDRTSTGRTVGEEPFRDVSLSQLEDEFHPQYIQNRKEYDKFFDKIDKSELKKLADGDYSNEDLVRVLTNKAKNDFPDMQKALKGWQVSPGGAGATAIRNLASNLEKRMGNAISWGDSAQVSSMLSQSVASKLTKQQYLKLRAFNQSFMNAADIGSMKIYRGLGGPSGLRIKEAAQQAQLAGTEFGIKDLTVSGWSTKKEIAQEFAGDFGVWIEETVSKRSVFVHDSLLNSITESTAYREEFETFIFTGNRKFGVNSIKWFK